jgi:hypothetical protein
LATFAFALLGALAAVPFRPSGALVTGACAGREVAATGAFMDKGAGSRGALEQATSKPAQPKRTAIFRIGFPCPNLRSASLVSRNGPKA